MAEVLCQNVEDRASNRASALLRSLVFKYYIHDSVSTLRFQLIGDLREINLSELNGSWQTASTTLGLRRFILDVNQLYSSDDEGRRWLRKMREHGALFQPVSYLDAVPQGQVREQCMPVRLSLLGRVLGLTRGVKPKR